MFYFLFLIVCWIPEKKRKVVLLTSTNEEFIGEERRVKFKDENDVEEGDVREGRANDDSEVTRER